LYKIVVNPVVYEYWKDMKETILEVLGSADLHLTGDGQFDSPGYSKGFQFFLYFFLISEYFSRGMEDGGGRVGGGGVIMTNGFSFN
jgi:hypothetical protein